MVKPSHSGVVLTNMKTVRSSCAPSWICMFVVIYVLLELRIRAFAHIRYSHSNGQKENIDGSCEPKETAPAEAFRGYGGRDCGSCCSHFGTERFRRVQYKRDRRESGRECWISLPVLSREECAAQRNHRA